MKQDKITECLKTLRPEKVAVTLRDGHLPAAYP